MENIELLNSEKKLHADDLLKIENNLGISLPKSFIEFYLKNNGGRPSRPMVKDLFGNIDDIEIRDFWSFLYNKKFENDSDYTLEGRVKDEWNKLEVPKNLLPFAIDWGGNYICIDINDGSIFYYVRDVWSDKISVEQNFIVNSTKIAPAFEAFLENLMPLDEDD